MPDQRQHPNDVPRPEDQELSPEELHTPGMDLVEPPDALPDQLSEIPARRLSAAGVLRPVPGPPPSPQDTRRESLTERVERRKMERQDDRRQEPAAATAPVPLDEFAGGEQESREWRRKARDRRLTSGETRVTGTETVTDFSPAFSTRRALDTAPDFDQPGAPAAEARRAGSLGRSPAWAVCLFTFGVGLAGLLVAWMAGLVGNNEAPATVKNKTSSTPGSTSADPAVAKSRSIAEKVPEAREVTQRFFAAATLEEKAALVRGGTAMLPAMRKYYALHPDEPGTITLNGIVEFENHGQREFIRLAGITGQDIPFTSMLEVTPAGPRLDWRYQTGAGEMEWTEWVRERPVRPVSMRVLATLDDYYAGEFANRKEWLCVRITDNTYHSTVWAYVGLLSNESLAILQKIAGTKFTMPLMATFEFPPPVPGVAPTAAPQVILRSIAEKGWMDLSPEAGGTPPP